MNLTEHSFQLDCGLDLFGPGSTFGHFNILMGSSQTVFLIPKYFDSSEPYGKQLIYWFITILIVLILSIDAKFYERFASITYLLSLVAL